LSILAITKEYTRNYPVETMAENDKNISARLLGSGKVQMWIQIIINKLL